MSPRIIATVQVRMGSERLPGKSLRVLAGKPLLAHLIDRVRLTKGLDGMVVATPESSENDVIEKFCTSYGVPCFRGSEDDVLGRMLGALESQHADVGVEVYGDSPLVDPTIIREFIESYLADPSYDWIGNGRVTTFPGGMDTEVFSVAALRDAAKRTQDPAIREHGTLYLRQHPGLYKLKDIEVQGIRRRPDICLEVDEEADVEIIEAILRHFSPRIDFSVEEIIAFLDQHSSLATSNQNVFRRWKQYRVNSPHGETTVRPELLPYSRQSIDEDDVCALTDVMRSVWLTTGPKVQEFEQAFAAAVGAKEAVAVNSGTAALHAAFFAINLQPGDEVIVPSMTFAATANAAAYLGGIPVFVDSDPATLLIDPKKAEAAITKKTKAIIAVDYAGHPCDYNALKKIADRHGITLLADACHAIGGAYKGRPVGSLAKLSCFSFHPVKPMTTGEGGMITTNDASLAKRMRQFRNHGITTDHRERHEAGSWFYEMVDLGYNYRLTDFQCALGLSQLKHIPAWTARRQMIAKKYDAVLASMDAVKPLFVQSDVSHAYHLYVIQLNLERLSADRGEIFRALRAENIGVNVHYIPAHLHPFYRERFGTAKGLCPVAEAAYERIISLPIFAGMTDADVRDVLTAIKKVCLQYQHSS